MTDEEIDECSIVNPLAKANCKKTEYCHTCTRTPILEVRWSYGHLIFIDSQAMPAF